MRGPVSKTAGSRVSRRTSVRPRTPPRSARPLRDPLRRSREKVGRGRCTSGSLPGGRARAAPRLTPRSPCQHGSGAGAAPPAPPVRARPPGPSRPLLAPVARPCPRTPLSCAYFGILRQQHRIGGVWSTPRVSWEQGRASRQAADAMLDETWRLRPLAQAGGVLYPTLQVEASG